MTPPHPGEITSVDGNTGEVLSVQPASELPDTIRYAPDENGDQQPIVRLVFTTHGDRREIAQVTADGRVLRRTYQTR